MAAANYSTSFRQGETFSLQFVLVASGSAVDLTGCSFALSMTTEPTLNSVNQGTQSPITYTLTSYFSIPTPSNGTAILTVPASVTVGYTVGHYRYDLKFTDASGNVFYYLTGFIDVQKAVTS